MDFGVPFVEPHWHFWLGVGVAVLINFAIGSSQYLHHYQKWLYYLLPVVFGAIVWFALGVIGGMGV